MRVLWIKQSVPRRSRAHALRVAQWILAGCVIGLAVYLGRKPWLLGWMLSPLIVGLHIPLVRAWFRLRVRQFDALRRGEGDFVRKAE